nr:aminopeptidase N [uncultured bacterium]
MSDLLGKSGNELKAGVLTIKDKEQNFVFKNLTAEPTPSWFRGFSAPVKLTDDLTFEQKIFLVKHDKDSFSQWDNAQQLWQTLILTPGKIDELLFFDAIEFTVKNVKDKSLICELLTLPSERVLHNAQTVIDVFDIHNKRERVIEKIRTRFKALFFDLYQSLNTSQAYELTPEAVGQRALKNICLFYLSEDSDIA